MIPIHLYYEPDLQHRQLDQFLEESTPEQWVHEIIHTMISEGVQKDYEIVLHCSESNNIETTELASFFKEVQKRNLFRLERDLKFMKKQSLNAALKGVAIMLTALSFNYYFEKLTEMNYPKFLTKEALYIVGWVSMWKPIELVLYERWPLNRRRLAYE
ncbi:MAG: hypothetical protein MUE33_00690 [Cytophagaceae bacterium]|jgi:hypothetical protein|nr:hypothetical protein [Cytophagaceae bacterium]